MIPQVSDRAVSPKPCQEKPVVRRHIGGMLSFNDSRQEFAGTSNGKKYTSFILWNGVSGSR
ncbi:hypothetical protein [Microcoleus sp. FACHB-68]|uniref:hypothetical protein n=1 Tax=Microcoleus sp. FACHB-68 TaxID=2692826 RepID=UPI0016860F30|nr:hypothetical protein [Microcoleus sp. FACHB-68]MBD1940156.1 hypothetical protein [Microcoleus sp. FACHB-68]